MEYVMKWSILILHLWATMNGKSQLQKMKPILQNFNEIFTIDYFESMVKISLSAGTSRFFQMHYEATCLREESFEVVYNLLNSGMRAVFLQLLVFVSE
mmetsp:Transcript_16648/g.25149  ORF Transcript_16648/g.25149 Transcript_16648/m.25149 type:complete len:98 (+) Transcript_16648:1101-1394(+)